MYRVVKGPETSLPDVGVFLDILNRLGEHPLGEVRELFDPRQELVVTRAPGRLDVMGGIADTRVQWCWSYQSVKARS
jgi:hypothetical protein